MRDKLLVQQSCQSYAAYEGWESLRLSVMMYAYMIKEDRRAAKLGERHFLFLLMYRAG